MSIGSDEVFMLEECDVFFGVDDGAAIKDCSLKTDLSGWVISDGMRRFRQYLQFKKAANNKV